MACQKPPTPLVSGPPGGFGRRDGCRWRVRLFSELNLLPDGAESILGIYVGGDLAGNIGLSLRTGATGRAHFDAISLEVVPEPKSLRLAAFGILGRLGIRRR